MSLRKLRRRRLEVCNVSRARLLDPDAALARVWDVVLMAQSLHRRWQRLVVYSFAAPGMAGIWSTDSRVGKLEAATLSSIDSALVGMIAGFLITWSGTVAWLTWWLGKQFADSREMMRAALDTAEDEILEALTKLEVRLDRHDERIRKLEVEHASWPALLALAKDRQS